MTYEEYLLTCLIEECAEIQHATCKALRFGLHNHCPESKETNREVISKEISDLLSVIHILNTRVIINPQTISEEKIERVKDCWEYSKHSKGTVI